MSYERRDYVSYMLRMWRSSSSPQAVWQASLEDPRTGTRKGFAKVEDLIAFLQSQVRERDAREAVDRG